MRAIGLLVLLLGALSLLAPTMREALPFLGSLDDNSLRIAGGGLAVVGAIVMFMTREE